MVARENLEHLETRAMTRGIELGVKSIQSAATG